MFGTERCTVCFTMTVCRSARILLASRTDRAYLSPGRLPIQNIAESFIAQVPNYQISAASQALEQRHSPSGQGDGVVAAASFMRLAGTVQSPSSRSISRRRASIASFVLRSSEASLYRRSGQALFSHRELR
jgi:hypothetical protein